MYVLFLGACHFSESITCTPDSMTGIFNMPLAGDMGVSGQLGQQPAKTKSQLTATAWFDPATFGPLKHRSSHSAMSHPSRFKVQRMDKYSTKAYQMLLQHSNLHS
jgi:hypothetical protein